MSHFFYVETITQLGLIIISCLFYFIKFKKNIKKRMDLFWIKDKGQYIVKYLNIGDVNRQLLTLKIEEAN